MTNARMPSTYRVIQLGAPREPDGLQSNETVTDFDSLVTHHPNANRHAHMLDGRIVNLAASALLLLLLVGWLLLGYYRRELDAAQSELQRHEQAIPILQAYAASDAVLCDGHLCVNTDGAAPARGEKRQYRPAKPRQ